MNVKKKTNSFFKILQFLNFEEKIDGLEAISIAGAIYDGPFFVKFN